MSMELRRTTTKKDFDMIKSLYIEAFPKCERAPFFFIKQRAKDLRGECWNIEENGHFIGMAYVIGNSKLAYLFYFAISKEMRGKGYGSRALSLIMDKYKNKKLFLALEDWKEDCDNKLQRIKRHEFYENCGLIDLPYKLREVNMVYSVMGTKREVGTDNFRQLADDYLGRVICKFIKMRLIEINETQSE